MVLRGRGAAAGATPLSLGPDASQSVPTAVKAVPERRAQRIPLKPQAGGGWQGSAERLDEPLVRKLSAGRGAGKEGWGAGRGGGGAFARWPSSSHRWAGPLCLAEPQIARALAGGGGTTADAGMEVGQISLGVGSARLLSNGPSSDPPPSLNAKCLRRERIMDPSRTGREILDSEGRARSLAVFAHAK